MVQWYITLWRIVWWVFSRLWAPLMAVGWPLLALYGAFQPRHDDLAALRLQRGEIAVLVGLGGGGSTCVNSQPCQVTPSQRSYLVFPRSIRTGAGFVVEDTAPSLTVEQEQGAALLIIAIWILCAYGTWVIYVRKPRADLTCVRADAS